MNSTLKHSLKKGQATTTPPQVLESCLLRAQTSLPTSAPGRTIHQGGTSSNVISSDPCKSPRG